MTKKNSLKLRDIPQYHPTVTLSSGHVVEVRPINLVDIMTLLGAYGPKVAISFGKLRALASAKKLTEMDVRKALSNLFEEAPDLIVGLIALSNDDYTDEGKEAAAGIPLPDQLAVLDTLLRETMKSEGAVKKLVSSLIEGLTTIYGATTSEMKDQILTSSTGPSDGK